MWKPLVCACGLVLALAAPAAAQEKAPKLRLKNEASRTAYCVILVDGKTRNYLNIRPGRTFTAEVDPGRDVQVVCERTKKNVYGPLKLETDYAFVDAGRRFVDLVEAAAE